jgi:hypothetical protein
MALIALLCTGDSVHEPVHAHHGDHRMSTTERYSRPAGQHVRARWNKAASQRRGIKA